MEMTLSMKQCVSTGNTTGLDVVTAGETMLRLSPSYPQQMSTCPQLAVGFAGTESNFAITLRQLGMSVGWIGRVSDDVWGRRLLGELRRFQVDVSAASLDKGAPLGIIFYQHSANPRPDFVIYNRKRSAASRLSPDDINWEYVRKARHVHLTGITPALSPSCLATTKALADFARGEGLTMSIDVNYRSKLWTAAEAAKTLAPIMTGADLVIVTASDAAELFGLDGRPEDVCRAAAERFEAANVCLTLGGQGALAFDGRRFYSGVGYEVEVVDSLGAGDAFSAGLVYGFLKGDLQEGTRLGSALAALKLTVPGDHNLFDQMELQSVLALGDSTGGLDTAVQR